MNRLEIDVYSDFVCPWCFIGSRRLQEALRNNRPSGGACTSRTGMRSRSPTGAESAWTAVIARQSPELLMAPQEVGHDGHLRLGRCSKPMRILAFRQMVAYWSVGMRTSGAPRPSSPRTLCPTFSRPIVMSDVLVRPSGPARESRRQPRHWHTAASRTMSASDSDSFMRSVSVDSELSGRCLPESLAGHQVRRPVDVVDARRSWRRPRAGGPRIPR